MQRLMALLAALMTFAAFAPGVLAQTPETVATPGSTPVAAGNDCRGADGQGLIVYPDIMAGDDDDSDAVIVSLVIFSADGTEVDRIPVDGFPILYPLIGCTVLINGMDSGPALFDAGSGTLRSLSLSATSSDSLYPVNSWLRGLQPTRWAFLSDGSFGSTLLVDTATGTVTDLTAIVLALRGDTNDPVVPVSIELTPDEAAFLLVTDRDVWVVPTKQPDRARLVSDALGSRASLSDNGTALLYLAETGDDQFAVVTEQLDGSNQAMLAGAERQTVPVWVPGSGGREILIVDALGGERAIRLLAGGVERSIDVALPGTLAARPIFSPSGKQVLLRSTDEDTAWTWIDLDSGRGQRLTELDGYPIPYNGLIQGLRWLTFFPSNRASVEPGAEMKSLDLETGEVKVALTFAFEETYLGILYFSASLPAAEGRFVTVVDTGAEYPRFWLLDAAQGTSVEYSGRLPGTFSPDGSKLIVSEPVSDDTDNFVWRTSILTVASGELEPLAESFGRAGYWLPTGG